MKRKTKIQFILGASLLGIFILYTVSLRFVDLQPIGPAGSFVAYAELNRWVQDFVGVNWTLYHITDWAGVAVILVALGFALLGLLQWIRRKSIRKVDPSILALGVYYVLVFGAYAFFECCVINYRPVLINGILEASYPSSTTMLALCILPAAMMQFHRLIRNCRIRTAVNWICGLFTVFMVIGRLLSGVHWFTDIFGAMLFSTAMILLYGAADHQLR